VNQITPHGRVLLIKKQIFVFPNLLAYQSCKIRRKITTRPFFVNKICTDSEKYVEY
jgi:hypothetical protein